MNNLEINNPLNMRPSNPPWQGEVGVRNGFAQFDTMPNGIRASMRQLLVYQEGRRKINWLGYLKPERKEGPGIIPTWAPDNENDTTAYINYVCKVCELKQDDRINLRDRDTMFWVWTGMAEMEQGRRAIHAAITEQMIDAGMEEAFA